MAGRKSSGGYDLESSLSHLLRRAQQFAYDQFVQQMGDGSITPRQFIVLFAVNEEEGLSQTDLVNRTGIDRSTLADMISRMIKNGLLARKRTAEDARANAVRSYLIQHGVSGALISAEGRGPAEPLVNCPGAATPEVIACLAPNRRTSVAVQAR